MVPKRGLEPLRGYPPQKCNPGASTNSATSARQLIINEQVIKWSGYAYTQLLYRQKIKTQKKKINKAQGVGKIFIYFLTFRLNPMSPMSPEPKRSMVEVSGTGAHLSPSRTAQVPKSSIIKPAF